MDESVKQILLKVSKVLHFLGKYKEANIIIDLAVICGIKGCVRYEQLKEWRDELEKNL